MILEVAVLNVRSGEGGDFERLHSRRRRRSFRPCPATSRINCRRCLESQDKYLLLVQWQKLEDHTIGFRQSPQYQDWKRLLHHFYGAVPDGGATMSWPFAAQHTAPADPDKMLVEVHLVCAPRCGRRRGQRKARQATRPRFAPPNTSSDQTSVVCGTIWLSQAQSPKPSIKRLIPRPWNRSGPLIMWRLAGSKLQRVYLDTSALGGCFDPEFSEWSNGLVQDSPQRPFQAAALPGHSYRTAGCARKSAGGVRRIADARCRNR